MLTAPYLLPTAVKLQHFYHRSHAGVVPRSVVEQRLRIRVAVDARIKDFYDSIKEATGVAKPGASSVFGPSPTASFHAHLTTPRGDNRLLPKIEWNDGDYSYLRDMWVETGVSLRKFELLVYASRWFWRREDLDQLVGRSRSNMSARFTRLYLKDLSIVRAELRHLIETIEILRFGYMTDCSSYVFERLVTYVTVSPLKSWDDGVHHLPFPFNIHQP